jgi:hypothetical protein
MSSVCIFDSNLASLFHLKASDFSTLSLPLPLISPPLFPSAQQSDSFHDMIHSFLPPSTPTGCHEDEYFIFSLQEKARDFTPKREK